MSWFLRMILLVLPAIFIVYVYVGSRFTAAIGELTPWRRSRIRLAVIAGIGYLLLYPLLLLSAAALQATTLRNALSSGLNWANALFTFPFWAGLIAVAELLPLFFVMDLAQFVFRPLYKKHQLNWRKWQARITVALSAFMIIYVIARIVHDTNSVQLSTHELALPKLPAALEGFRIVQLSDLQADPYTDEQKMLPYIELANAQKPDVIVFCGDLVTRGRDHISQGANVMGRLQARLGAFACLGDHDYWADPRTITQQLSENGITTVEDSVLTLAASLDGSISLTILTNVYNRRPSRATLDRLREQRPEYAAVHLMLSHQPTPSLIQFARDSGYHLLLAGHTHGGQVVFKPFGFPLSVSQRETPYFSGLYQVGDLLVSVTNGLGLTFAPFRYQAPAEVTLIVLRRG
jgi:predicted MPP superfamily phosphohydrolase